MTYFDIAQSHAEGAIDALESVMSESDFDLIEFERKYLDTYDTIFTGLSKIATVSESGERESGELSMSKWVEPSKAIGVVVENKSALRPEIIKAIQNILTAREEKFVVVLDDFPTILYIFPDGVILVIAGSLPDDLRRLGLLQ